jgi:hypothetical protein
MSRLDTSSALEATCNISLEIRAGLLEAHAACAPYTTCAVVCLSGAAVPSSDMQLLKHDAHGLMNEIQQLLHRGCQ